VDRIGVRHIAFDESACDLVGQRCSPLTARPGHDATEAFLGETASGGRTHPTVPAEEKLNPGAPVAAGFDAISSLRWVKTARAPCV